MDLELDPVTVLVGRTGTGKSNLVQAIKFLRNLLINQEHAINYEVGWERIIPVGEKKPKTSFEVTFSVPGENRDYVYQVEFVNHPHYPGLQIHLERLDLGNESLFWRYRPLNDFQWKWEKTPRIAVLPHHPDSPILGNFPSLQEVVLAYAALTSGIGYYHFQSSTLALPSLYGHGQQILAALTGLSDDAGNFREIMRRMTQDFQHPNLRKSLLASLKTVNPSIDSIELDSLTNPQRAIISHKFADLVFSLNLDQESDGLRRFYAHLLALYQSPPKLTLIFEEPENAIYPGALSVLADEFKDAPGENRGQVILTTHNPILLDFFDVENLRVVEMQHGRTLVGLVSKEQREAVRERLLTTGELLTEDKARLEEPKAAQAV